MSITLLLNRAMQTFGKYWSCLRIEPMNDLFFLSLSPVVLESIGNTERARRYDPSSMATQRVAAHGRGIKIAQGKDSGWATFRLCLLGGTVVFFLLLHASIVENTSRTYLEPEDVKKRLFDSSELMTCQRTCFNLASTSMEKKKRLLLNYQTRQGRLIKADRQSSEHSCASPVSCSLSWVIFSCSSPSACK